MRTATPLKIKEFFWDVCFDSLDVDSNYFFVIERIFNHGDILADDWIVRNYAKSELINVLKSSYNLSRAAAHKWSVRLQVSLDHCACMKKPSALLAFS